jgi:hypothetical protein
MSHHNNSPFFEFSTRGTPNITASWRLVTLLFDYPSEDGVCPASSKFMRWQQALSSSKVSGGLAYDLGSQFHLMTKFFAPCYKWADHAETTVILGFNKMRLALSRIMIEII